MASIGDRMLALVFDRVLIAALVVAVAALLSDRRMIALPVTSLSMSIGAVASAVLIVFLYHFALEAAFGTTPGKSIFGLRVRNIGDRGRIATAAIRNGLRVVDALGMYAVGFFIALFSNAKQRLGDHIAHAVVVEQPVHRGVRAVIITIWVVVIGAAIWFAAYLCPDCAPKLIALR